MDHRVFASVRSDFSGAGVLPMKPVRIVVFVALVGLLVLLVSTQITIFVVPPIGAVPEGRTVIITRLNKTEFIDSPDGMCERMQGGVSILCRGVTMAAVIQKSTVLLRLPYSQWLYLISTRGKTYDR